jgi:hypothetical protein
MAGRPKYQPTAEHRREVLVMAGFGIVQEQIAKMLDIDPKTLRRAFRRELDVGMTEASVRVAKSLFEMATKDKVPAAAIFWMKARAGWKEKQDITIEGTQTLQLAHLTAARSMSEQIHSQLIEAAPDPSEDEPREMEPAIE